MNSTCKSQLITGKLYIDDYSNFPTAGDFVMFLYVQYLDPSYKDAFYAELF